MEEKGASTVTVEMIKTSATLAGLEFPDDELTSMVQAVNQNLGRYVALHELHIPNNVGPPKVASNAASRRPIVGWLNPSARPAARNEPCRATARKTRTSSQSIGAEPFAATMIRLCIGDLRICRSLISTRITN